MDTASVAVGCFIYIYRYRQVETRVVLRVQLNLKPHDKGPCGGQARPDFQGLLKVIRTSDVPAYLLQSGAGIIVEAAWQAVARFSSATKKLAGPSAALNHQRLSLFLMTSGLFQHDMNSNGETKPSSVGAARMMCMTLHRHEADVNVMNHKGAELGRRWLEWAGIASPHCDSASCSTGANFKSRLKAQEFMRMSIAPPTTTGLRPFRHDLPGTPLLCQLLWLRPPTSPRIQLSHQNDACKTSRRCEANLPCTWQPKLVFGAALSVLTSSYGCSRHSGSVFEIRRLLAAFG